MVACLNCDMVFEGAFCASCGQKATTQRINWQSFILELPQTLLSIGFLWEGAIRFSIILHDAIILLLVSVLFVR